MKDLDFWLKTIGIILVAIIIMVVIAGCQLFQKDRESTSDCRLTCKDCKGLTMDCELNTERTNKYTVNQPEKVEDEQR